MTGTRGVVVAWCGFVFGSVTSVAANILHTLLPAAHASTVRMGPAPQVIAAVWPIVLLLSVEVLTRVRWPQGWLWLVARFGGGGTVAAGSAVISYGHMRDVLSAWGYPPLSAGVGPLTIDGLMVVCGFALLSMTVASPDHKAMSVPAPVDDSVPAADAASGLASPVLPAAAEVAAPVAGSVPAAVVARPVPAAVRSSLPVQTMLPISMPVNGGAR